MKKYKRPLALLFACAMMLSLSDNMYAVELAEESGEYLEAHFQINFTNIIVETTATNGLNLRARDNLSTVDAVGATSDISRLEGLFERYENLESNLARTMSDTGESLLAVSFTEIPLQVVDGHYERIPASTNGEGASTPNGRGNFLFYTTINGGEDVESGDYYNYYTNTIGEWSTASLLGENYQSIDGYDYVLQTYPNTFAQHYNAMTVRYQTAAGLKYSGSEGSQYWRQDVGDSFVKYAIDDYYMVSTTGRYCQTFTLYSRISGPKSTTPRSIYSYYVHTWETLTLGVSISLDTSTKVTLTLTPSLTEKSWQVANYVTFSF